MRPQKLRRVIQEAIDKSLKEKNLTHLTSLKPHLKQMRKVWLRMYEEERQYVDNQVDSGFPDNIYLDCNIEDLEEDYLCNHLVYISDRWRCANRLGWLCEGLEKDFFLHVSGDNNVKNI